MMTLQHARGQEKGIWTKCKVIPVLGNTWYPRCDLKGPFGLEGRKNIGIGKM